MCCIQYKIYQDIIEEHIYTIKAKEILFTPLIRDRHYPGSYHATLLVIHVRLPMTCTN